MQNTFCLTQKHTLLQAATSQATKQSLQESMFFATQERNSNIFSPTLWCFNFFANAQPTTDKQSDSLLQTSTGQCNLARATEARTANKVLPLLVPTNREAGVTNFYETFCAIFNPGRPGFFKSIPINRDAETPRLRQARQTPLSKL